MSQVDFIMGILITLGVISFAIYYVSGDFSSQMSQMSVAELRASVNVLENKLIYDLQENSNLIKIRFQEIGDKDHTEQININFAGKVGDYKVYDLDTLIASGTGNTITIPVSLGKGQVRYMNVFFNGTGVIRDITGDKNVSVRALSPQTYTMISELKCLALDYNKTKDFIGHYFKAKIGSCEVGLNPPQETVVANSFPVIVNYKSEIANVMVW